MVWILILITHMRFRIVRARHNLPNSPARLKGAPVTTVLAILFLTAVLVSTIFIDGLTWTWMAGIPFFALLLIAYYFVDKRTHAGGDRYDPLQEEVARSKDASPDADLEPAAEGAH